MKKKLDLATLLSAVHLCFVMSIVCFSVTYLSLGILALPALTSAFRTGRDVIYKKYDIYDSVVKTFFKRMKTEMRMMRYFPIQFIIILQAVGIYAAGKVEMDFLVIPLVVGIASLLTLLIYIAAYHVFYSELPSVADVVIAMFYRIQYMTIIWMLMLLASVFFGTVFIAVSLFIGAIALFAVEAVAFLGITAFRKLKGELTEEEIELMGEDILKKI